MSIPAFNEPRPTAVFDTECYRNYWSIGFKSITDKRDIVRLRRTGSEELDVKRLATIFKHWRVIGFNSINYDMPMIALAASGASNAKLKEASDAIILQNLKPWEFYELYGVNPPPFLDHIDLMEVSPGSPQKPSLKMYAGRLHSKTMKDLPFEPDHVLSRGDVEVLERYHANDLDVTEDFARELRQQVELRAEMSVQYGVDVRSKSDAQVAEAVIKAEIERALKRRIYKPDVKAHSFKYKPPVWVKFKTPVMQEMLRKIVETNFVVSGKGEVELPETLAEADIPIGNSVYRMGIGGLHSSESQVSHFSDDEFVILDRDVTSYYPSIIINNNLYPPHLGEVFLKVYRSILERRVAAKKAGNKTVAETLKIVLNGSFGKFGSPYSTLYAPNLMIQTTLTGQLAILMLIEALELRGMQVISANTDGFVTKVPRARRDEFNALLTKWEGITSLGTEETQYRSLHSASVNSYIAFKCKFDKERNVWIEDQIDEIKRKGSLLGEGGPGKPGAAGMKKNPTNEVCIDALIAYLLEGTPFLTTIMKCRDIRKFVTIRKVKGGCVKDGELVGKVVRWYYSTSTQGPLKYRSTGNNVAKSDGAMPIMTLPDEFPNDVDYAWYVREATALLAEIGLPALDPDLAHRRGVMWARNEDEKTAHLVRLPSGVAYCGKVNESIRDRWVEGAPLTSRLRCKKCVEATGI